MVTIVRATVTSCMTDPRTLRRTGRLDITDGALHVLIVQVLKFIDRFITFSCLFAASLQKGRRRKKSGKNYELLTLKRIHKNCDI